MTILKLANDLNKKDKKMNAAEAAGAAALLYGVGKGEGSSAIKPFTPNNNSNIINPPSGGGGGGMGRKLSGAAKTVGSLVPKKMKALPMIK